MLDEIGDIDANIQIKLLRFLETRLIQPIGSDKDIELDIQIVAATHRDLPKAVAEGAFREDLYQRLKVMVVDIPPLRNRKDDIPLIVEHQLNREGFSQNLITPEAFEKLMQYEWKGNVRELINTVNHMILRREILQSSYIRPECLPMEILQFDPNASTSLLSKVQENTSAPLHHNASLEPGNPLSHEEAKALIDLQAIERALAVKNGKKQDVAQMTGYGTSDNLRYKIKTLYQQFPHLFTDFGHIRSSYSRIVK